MPAQGPYRVLLVDDHRMLREGIKALLSDDPLIQIVGEGSTGQEALTLSRTRPADFLLLDHSLPDADGVSLIRTLTRERPDLRVIMLTAHTEAALVAEALESGARGFLPKSATCEELRQAFRCILEGGTVLHPSLVQQTLREQRRRAESPQGLLTERELEILHLVTLGHSNPAIASRLFLSESTVKTHLRNLFRKLEVSNRSELVARSLREGLLEPGPAEPPARRRV